MAARDLDARLAGSAPQAGFTPGELEGLPERARRLLQRLIAPGRP